MSLHPQATWSATRFVAVVKVDRHFGGVSALVDDFGRFPVHNQIAAEQRGPLLFLLSLRRLADRVAHDFRQVLDETIEHVLHSAKLLGNIVDLMFDAIEPRLDGGQIVAVAAGLFKDVRVTSFSPPTSCSSARNSSLVTSAGIDGSPRSCRLAQMNL